MLDGKRILVIEDEFIVAAMLCDILEEAGAEALGPVGRVDEGVKVIATEQFDAAVLDWNLHGESSSPLAEAMHQRNIPFIIATGYGVVEGPFADRPLLGKPYVTQVLLERLGQLLAD